MKPSRIIALAAIVAALSLAACTGSNTSLPNAFDNTANLRVINGNPAIGAPGTLDIYWQTTGTASPHTPLVAAIPYGVATDFIKEPALAGTLLVNLAGRPAPDTGTAATQACPVPQLSLNAKYTIVVVNNGGSINCELFQEFDYTSAPQYRPHDAAGAGTLAPQAGYGVITAASAPPGTPYTAQVGVPQGTLSFTGAGPATSFTAANPVTIGTFTGSITFAVGTTTSGTGPSLATLDSRYIFAAGSTSQPNTTGALNAAGSAGTSLFALDCGGATVAPNVPCTGGVALVGYIDRL